MIHYDESSGTYTLDRIRPEAIEALDREHTRVGPLKWKKGRARLSDAKSLARAAMSGFADPDTVSTRKESCETCPVLVRAEDGLFCGACRCGKMPMAKLDGQFMPKLKWSVLLCPLGRPGFTNSKEAPNGD